MGSRNGLGRPRRKLSPDLRVRRRDGGFSLVLDRAFVIGLDSGAPKRMIGFAREVGSEPAPGEQTADRDRHDLESLSRRLVDSVEGERRRVSRELHDEVGQLLTSLRILLHAGSIDRIAADEILDELFARVRDISTSLLPPMLEDLGLGPALSWHCQRFTARTGVVVNLMTRGLEGRYSSAVELAVFRVIQEALTNVARHSGATEAYVAIRGRKQNLECIVMDRGLGFDPRGTPPGASGLAGMRERILAVGGRLFLSSSPGRGTRLSLMIRNPRVTGAS